MPTTKNTPPMRRNSNIENVCTPRSAASEETRMLVEVPTSVQVPPKIAA